MGGVNKQNKLGSDHWWPWSHFQFTWQTSAECEWAPGVNHPPICNACRIAALLYSFAYPWHLAKCIFYDVHNVFIVENMMLLKKFHLKTKMLKSPLGRFRKFVSNDDE